MVFNLTNLLLTVDIFGQGIDFTINKNSKSKTIFGGLLTIAMILLCFSMFYINVQDLFHHKNPQVNVETQILTENPNVTLDRHSMPFAIAVYNNKASPINYPRYFKLIVESITAKKLNESDFISTSYNLVNCTKDNFPLISQSNFNENGLNTQLCLNNDINLVGSWRSNGLITTFLLISLKLCKNETLTDNCAPPDEINNFIVANIPYLNILFINTAINPQIYTDPISQNTLSIYKIIKLGTSKVNEIYLRQEVLESDDNFLFSIKDVYNSIAFDSIESDEQNIKDNLLVQYALFASNKKIIHHRIYTKIQTILAGVGGIANVLRVTFTIFSSIFSLIKRDESILNTILEYDLDLINQKENEHGDKKQFHIIDVKYENSKITNRQDPNSNHNEEYREGNKLELKLNKNPKIFSIENKIIGSQGMIYSINQTFNQGRMEDISERENINRKQTNLQAYINASVKSYSFNLKSVINSSDKISDLQNKNCKMNENKKKEWSFPIDKNKSMDATIKNILKMAQLQRKKSKLTFRFCEVIRAFLCPKFFMSNQLRNKKILYNKSKFVVEEFLDISNVIQKFEELEKLKIVLLSKKQLAFFKFLSNELISLDQEKLKKNNVYKYKQLNQNEEEMVNIIVKFRDKMNTNNNVTRIDKKLYSLLNPIFK